jgi:hypothetical protein
VTKIIFEAETEVIEMQQNTKHFPVKLYMAKPKNALNKNKNKTKRYA